jgi:hypothetical protein
MGEIKSTLDLVLEKTKHLSQSSAEKQAQVRKDIEMRINGLLQKYQDGVVSKAQLQRDYEALKTEFNLSENNIMANEVVNRLDPDLDNRVLLEVLEDCCHLDSGGIKGAINDHRDAYLTAAQSRMETLKEILAQKYFISGSAVVPNLEADEQWRREAQALNLALEQKLNQEKDRLGGSKIR